MWKKRKEIEGLSSGTIIGLKAALFQKEQEQKRFKATGAKPPKPVRKNAAIKKNKGVEERSRRDERQAAEEEKTLDASAAKLRQKSQLYERLVRGDDQLGSQANDPRKKYQDEDDGPYLVDFQKKSWDDKDDDRRDSQRRDSDRDRHGYDSTSRRDDYDDDDDGYGYRDRRDRSSDSGGGYGGYRDDDGDDRDDDAYRDRGWREDREGDRRHRSSGYGLETNRSRAGELYSGDMAQEEERRRWEEKAESEMAQEDAREVKRTEEIKILDQLVKQTKEGRERHQQLKEKRAARTKERLEKIREREEALRRKKEAAEGRVQTLPVELEKEEEAEEEERKQAEIEKEKEKENLYDPFADPWVAARAAAGSKEQALAPQASSVTSSSYPTRAAESASTSTPVHQAAQMPYPPDPYQGYPSYPAPPSAAQWGYMHPDRQMYLQQQHQQPQAAALDASSLDSGLEQMKAMAAQRQYQPHQETQQQGGHGGQYYSYYRQ